MSGGVGEENLAIESSAGERGLEEKEDRKKEKGGLV